MDDLDRFLSAQAPVYLEVLRELRQGRKSTHWMWFIFPQIAGLGHSEMSMRYAIAGLEHARRYLEHPVLGARLRECTGLVAATKAGTAEEVFGSIDATKLRSSMTLFHRAAPGEALFVEVIDRFFDGAFDPGTDRLLIGHPGGRAG
jgi:uncharacterized protein (DUF1810 family)